MRKRIISVALAVVMAVCLCACSTKEMRSKRVENENRNSQSSMFICIGVSAQWKVVYHKETKVMYVVSDSSYNYGTFTLLVNADGTPMLYEESGD